jgi:hypothetical protein
MTLTLQAVTIVTGFEFMTNQHWSTGALFLFALVMLAFEEKKLVDRDNAFHAEHEAEHDHPSQFNEDDPDWRA